MFTTLSRLSQKYIALFFFIILATNVFFRFYDLPNRFQFNWDQVENAWVMKQMIVDHILPLVGMVAKGNSGFYIGPAYYYLLVPFYYVFHMDPVAAGVFVGIVSLITCIVLFLVTREIFTTPVALLASLIYTVSRGVLEFDRVAWPVNFIPMVSLLVFYCLYKVLMGNSKYLLWLAMAVGFSFHFHFTAVYFPIIILGALPFIIPQKGAIKYGLLAIPLFLLWFVPNIIAEMQMKFRSSQNMTSYLSVYYHGLHFVRVMQLAKDAFIEFEYITVFPAIKFLKYLFVPAAVGMIFTQYEWKKTIRMTYMFVAWFCVPWLVMSVYKGEISNYYFSITRPIVAIVAAYCTVWIVSRKNIFFSLTVMGFWIYFVAISIYQFATISAYSSFPQNKTAALHAVQIHQEMQFSEGTPIPYLYFMYSYQQQNHK